MIGALISLGVLVTLVWSFFDPTWASKVFLFGIIFFEGLIFLVSRFDSPDHLEPFTDPFQLNSDEVYVVKRYHLFFKFPFASMQFSGALSLIQLTTFIWVPWLIYSKLWFTAVAIAVNYLIVGALAAQLNPKLFLLKASNGKFGLDARRELNAIDSALEKLQGVQ